MPEVDRMPPGRRCFARIDRFECACPHCGRLIWAGIDKHYLPKRLQGTARARAVAKQRPTSRGVWSLVWNPYSQRLRCPWCEHSFTVGLVFYPNPAGETRTTVPPPDCAPNAAELAEMRRLGGGWFADKARKWDDPANVVVSRGCSCPRLGVDPYCPLHGDLVLIGVNDRFRETPTRPPEGGEST